MPKIGDLTNKKTSSEKKLPLMFHEFNGTIFKQFTKPNSTTNKNLTVFQTELENSKKNLEKNSFCLWMTITLWVHLLYLFVYSNCPTKKIDKVLAFLYYITATYYTRCSADVWIETQTAKSIYDSIKLLWTP